MTTRIYNKNYGGKHSQVYKYLNFEKPDDMKNKRKTSKVVKRNRFGMGIITLRFLTEESAAPP